MTGTRDINDPSHSLYADDMSSFYKGNIANVTFLQELFLNYALCFGQVFITSKSTIFAGFIPKPILNLVLFSSTLTAHLEIFI